MPNLNDLQQRAEARSLRKQQREENAVKAHAQDQTLSDKQADNQKRAELVAADKAEAAKREAARIDAGEAPAPAPKKPTRAEATNRQKAVHVRQAEKDAQLTPKEVNVERELSKWDGEGSPPLHVLNAIAEQADRRIRDEGKEIASAAGKAAYEVYVGKLAGKRSRHAHMRAQMAAGEAQIALAKQNSNEQA